MAYELGVDLHGDRVVAAVHRRGQVEVVADRIASGDLLADLRTVRNSVSEDQGTLPRSTVIVHPTSTSEADLDPIRVAVSGMGLDRVGLLPRAVAIAYAPTGLPDVGSGGSIVVAEMGPQRSTLTRVQRRGSRWQADEPVAFDPTAGAGKPAAVLTAAIREVDGESSAVLLSGHRVVASLAKAVSRRLEIPVVVAGAAAATTGAAIAGLDRWAAVPVRPAAVPLITGQPGADLDDHDGEPATASATANDLIDEEPTKRRGALFMVAAMVLIFGGAGAAIAANLLSSDDSSKLDTRRLDLIGGEVQNDPDNTQFDVGLDDSGEPVVLGVVVARKPTTSTTKAPAPAPARPPRAAATPAVTAAGPTAPATTAPSNTAAPTTPPPTTAAPTTRPPTTLPPTTTPPTTVEPPKAGDPDFGWSPGRPRELEAVVFSDQSDPAPRSVSWAFPDGSTGSGPSATFVFTDNGKQKVVLTACWDDAGEVCRTRSRTIDVRPAERGDADFVWSPNDPAAGTAVSFSDTSEPTGRTLTWTFPDGTTSTSTNPTHTFAESGKQEVELEVCWDLNGDRCRSQTHEIKVSDPVEPAADRVAAASAQPATAFPGLPISLTDVSSPTPDSVTWLFPDGQTVSGSVVRVAFLSPGSREIFAEVCWSTPDECQTTSLVVTIAFG